VSRANSFQGQVVSGVWTIDGVLKRLAILAERRRAGSISSTRAEVLERALECQMHLLE